MWQYRQSNGELSLDGAIVAHGYSGSGEGKNNPQLQDVSNVGPIPRGLYTVLFPRTTVQHGPYVLPLVPAPSNEMFGRSGFLMHGDSIEHPGMASQGCIIQSRDVRTQVWSSNDHQLTVVL